MLDYALLLAQASDAAAKNSQNFWIALALLLVATIPTYLLGMGLAKALRVPEYGKKIGFIFVTIGLAVVVLVTGTPKFGIDLRGGVILVYEIDEEGTAATQDEAAQDASKVQIGDLVQALNERLNPGGVNEIQIREYGNRQVEVIVPDVSDEEKEAIKRRIGNAGQLEFLILATDPNRDEAINLVLNDPSLKGERFIRNAEGQLVGKWARVNWDENLQTKRRELAVHYTAGYFRNAVTGELIPEARQMDQATFEAFLQERGIENIDALMAVDPDPEYRVTGTDLAQATSSINEVGSYIVHFVMTGQGATRMGNLTGANTSDAQRGYYRYLGIVLDGNLRSAPSIQSRIDNQGTITGRFSRAEVEFLVNVLRSGKLPAVLRKEPISENQISPLLGADTIRKGTMSMAISIVAVLAFMLIYYRFAGLVACVALILNTLLVVAVMVMIRAAFTLPGLAGMVLTVGMAVDANVLIYERMREELARGAALRMAIRNGFSRAMSTIIDSNVTTIITAVVLYVIGTEQLKGFAVTLILGIVMSMYSAIFVARVIFDIAEKRRFITTVKMMDWWGKSQIDFVRLYWPTTIASLVLIAIGLVATVQRGKDMFDTDFLGGTTIEMLLVQPLPEDEVRSRIGEKFEPEKIDYTVTRIDVAGQPKETLYKIDTSIQEVKELEGKLEEIFRDDAGHSLLLTNKVAVSEVSLVKAEQPPAAPESTEKPTEPGIELDNKQPEPTKPADEKPAEEKPEEKPAAPQPSAEEKKPEEAPPAEPEKPAADKADEEKPAAEEKSAAEEEKPATEEKPAEEKPAEEKPADEKAAEGEQQVFRLDVPADLLAQAEEAAPAAQEEATPAPEAAAPATETPATETPAPATEQPAAETPAEQPAIVAANRQQSQVTLTFETAVNAATLNVLFTDAGQSLAKEGKLPTRFGDVSDNRPEWVKLKPEPAIEGWSVDSSAKSKIWVVTLDATLDEAKTIADAVGERVTHATVWNSSSKIGGKVAEKTRYQAIYAMVASLLGIIGYVWFRFHKLAFGVAAVVALVHDVLVTVGLLALSSWLAPFFGFVLIEEFKINLTVIAAILTLIGYSLNDTIVTFDRIREVKGKSPDLTPAMINRSINETLSRTFLTAGTTLIVVVILYTLGGSGIHGFAYAMLVGVIAGTYSSVFIAAPLLLVMRGPVPASQQKEQTKVKA